MKVHIQKNIAHWFVWIVIATILINVISTPLVADASILSPTANPVTAGKLIDMCLTRSGKVVNGDIREDVLTQTRNVLNNTATSYRQWCKDNGKAKSVETFREYLESDAYATLPFRLAKFPLELASFIEWLINGETLLDVMGNDVNEVLTEHDDKGNVTVPSETVNIINQVFDNTKSNYTSGWRYIDVKSVNDLPSAMFGTSQAYENAKAYISSSDSPTIFHVDKIKNVGTSIYLGDNFSDIYYLQTSGTSGTKWTMIDTNWSTYVSYYKVQYGASQFDATDSETFKTSAISSTGSAHFALGDATTIGFDLSKLGNYNNVSMTTFYGKNADKVIVYSSLQAIKDYSLGNTPYYLTNRQYSDSVDNSFNVSGEYIQNNGGTFAYEQIREQINNSNVTNDSSVSSIVNDYSQTIINNYNYTSPDSGEGEEGSEDDNENGGLLDGLGSVVEGIADLLGFLLKAIGEILGLIGNLFNTIFEGIKALGSVFGGFSGLLGELFPFIPVELITFVTIAIEAIIAIAVWKLLKK